MCMCTHARIHAYVSYALACLQHAVANVQVDVAQIHFELELVHVQLTKSERPDVCCFDHFLAERCARSASSTASLLPRAQASS